jgi:tRNA(Ile)-lysidine synthase TilS/MesJ
MAGLHWLNQKPGRVSGVIHVDHNTEFGVVGYQNVVSYCADIGLPVLYSKVNDSPPAGVSKEEWWRNQRYTFFEKWSHTPIVTCHTLDDCIEQYVISKLIRFSGNEVIPYYGPANTIRPFRTWKKEDIYTYCFRYGIPYVDDPSNIGEDNLRAQLRSKVIPDILEINPGMYRQVTRLVKASS